jgi:hypothetical protein
MLSLARKVLTATCAMSAAGSYTQPNNGDVHWFTPLTNTVDFDATSTGLVGPEQTQR